MRVTVTRNGEMVVETRDVREAAAFVRELRNGRAPKKQSRTARKKLELESEDVPLSGALVDTWNWLVAHDNPEGCHYTDVTRGLDIKSHTSIYRLNKLVEKELAHRTRPGCYRAGGS